MKKFVLSAVLTCASFSASAKDWTVIKFGTAPAYAPFESKASDGSLIGFDIDLGNAICQKLKAKCEWVENDFDGLIPALKARKFDAILASMNITEQRQKQIAFSDKVYNAPTRMIAPKGSPLQPTVESLKGKRIGVQQGTVQETYAKQRWAASGINVVSYQNQEQVYQDLTSGRLDASLQDAIEAEYGFLKTPKGKNFTYAGSDIADPKIFGVGTGIGMRKEDEELRKDINRALAEIIKDGTYKRIASKYFSFEIYSRL
ncbi:MAG: ABC transporter substrate-binding protein [Pseudogulbenkiania sp.]|nr:ABC transporter substrate-binding protein [Pseudogulbenkiania sp.]